MISYQLAVAATRQYHGSGHALVAITDNEAVAISYVGELLPELGDDEIAAALDAMADDRLMETARGLSRQGHVIAGMCSSWEVVRLRSVMPASYDADTCAWWTGRSRIARRRSAACTNDDISGGKVRADPDGSAKAARLRIAGR